MKKERKLLGSMFFFIICYSLFLLLFFAIEPDYFWHIKAGEYMFHHGVIRHDVFSWLLNGKYWMSHEWLFEIILYVLKMIFGKVHVMIYSFIFVLLLLILLFVPNRRKMICNIPYSFIVLTFFFPFMLLYIQARPHMISFCLLAMTFYVLYDLYLNENSKKLFVLPFITILWANVHGGSSNLPYLLCFLFLIGGLFSFHFSKIEASRLSHKQFRKYFIVMILCMISVCINIHGVRMFLYPYQNMADTTMLQNIMEWRSTTLNELYHYVFYVFLLFVIFTMLFSKKKIRWMDLLLFGFSTYLGLKSVRFWMYTYIFSFTIIFYYMKERKMDKGTILSVYVISIFLLGCFLVNWNSIFTIKYQYNLSSDIIHCIKRENPKRLFNMYNYGGELVYHEIPVFVDGRADLYSKHNFKDYLEIAELSKDVEQLLEKYDFDYFLVSKDYPIYAYLNIQEKYQVIYEKKNIVLFQKV